MYILERQQRVGATMEQAWDFLQNPANLDRITPSDLRFRIVTEVPAIMHEGLIVEYRITIPLLGAHTWVTEIKHIHPGHSFVDEQRLGPYRFWYHYHEIRQEGDAVLLVDRVCYQPPRWARSGKSSTGCISGAPWSGFSTSAASACTTFWAARPVREPFAGLFPIALCGSLDGPCDLRPACGQTAADEPGYAGDGQHHDDDVDLVRVLLHQGPVLAQPQAAVEEKAVPQGRADHREQGERQQFHPARARGDRAEVADHRDEAGDEHGV